MFEIAKIYNNSIRYLAAQDFVFPAGEVSVKLNAGDYAYQAIDLPHTIIARIENSDDIMKLALVRDALLRFDNRPVNLFMPYVPFARQDRVCDKGEAFSVVIFAKLVAAMGFENVTMVDPHSEVAPAAFEAAGLTVKVIKQVEIINRFQPFIERVLNMVTFVSPDAGANKKTADVASFFQQDSFIRADKLRDLTNGKIKEIIVYCDDLKGRDVCIVDDLCEKGGTFIGLAKALKAKNAGKILLYVSHGVFGGKNEVQKTIANLLNGGIDEIWTTDSYNKELHNFASSKLRVMSLEERLLM